MHRFSSLVDRLVKLLLRLRNRHFVVLDLVVFIITPALALALRLESMAGIQRFDVSLAILTLAFLPVKLAVFYAFGLYNRYWRYASIDELAKITAGVVAAVVVQTLFFYLIMRPFGWIAPEFPRSVPLLDGLLVLLLAGGTRYSIRLAQRLQQHVRMRERGRRVLIVGAGEAGIVIAEEMRSNPGLGLQPVAFVDDSPDKQRIRIRGLDVLGRRGDIPDLVHDLDIGLIVIAIPHASGREIREIATICEQTGVETKTVPGVFELLGEHITVHQLRDVQVEDLLRRSPIQTDTTQVAALLRGATVLVTGAGGSIGSELCRQIIPLQPGHLILLGHGENTIFAIEAELRRRQRELGGAAVTNVQAVIGDIRDQHRMAQIFSRFQPDVVFHAAAHKHVPLMESNIEDAVTNNVLGTRNVLELAEAFDVRRFVLISTDKAVNPTSIMGATKRIAELMVQEMAARGGRAFTAVRFGNVLGSRGSVLEVFRRQLGQGGPLTVTHPDIERYFMTIPEAAHLVLQAATLARGGEIFLLDMGEPTKIVDLARDLIRLSSRKGSKEIDVVFTGLRPGEKMTEELVAKDEIFGPTEHEKILVCTHNGHARTDGQERFVHLLGHVDQLIDLAQQGEAADLMALLADLVPDFSGDASALPCNGMDIDADQRDVAPISKE